MQLYFLFIYTVVKKGDSNAIFLLDSFIIDTNLPRLSKAVKAPVSNAEVFRVRSGGNRINGWPGAHSRSPLPVQERVTDHSPRRSAEISGGNLVNQLN